MRSRFALFLATDYPSDSPPSFWNFGFFVFSRLSGHLFSIFNRAALVSIVYNKTDDITFITRMVNPGDDILIEQYKKYRGEPLAEDFNTLLITPCICKSYADSQ